MASGMIRIGVDARELTQLYRDLDAAGSDIAKEFLADIKAGGEAVRADAAAAAEGFSTRIPGTIRLVSSGGKAKIKVAVRAGNKTAPHAAALENRGQAGVFRHPLNWPNQRAGSGAWVDQTAHPYLLPALARNLDKVADNVSRTVDEALKKYRL